MIFKEGDEGEEFFIIESGEVDCLKLFSLGSKKGLLHVRTLSDGEHFGELALINNEKRSLSIIWDLKWATLLEGSEFFTNTILIILVFNYIEFKVIKAVFAYLKQMSEQLNESHY